MVIFLYKDAETRLDKGVFFSADQRFPLCERGRKKTFMRISDETYHIL